tara:strand:- start:1725 stop:4349 length:2625 start_codon:yes stop_codon:yes gene_type:complete
MKVNISILILLINFVGIAQNQNTQSSDQIPFYRDSTLFIEGDPRPYSDQMDEIISQLDKSEITTGILADKSVLLTSMHEFNGIKSKTISSKKWKGIYRQLYNAKTGFNTLISPDSLPKSNFNNVEGIDVVPLAMMNIDYNQFVENALANGNLQLVNRKLRRIKFNEPLYDKKKVFAIAPLKDQLYSGDVIFKLSSELIMENSNNKISSIEIDFGDGNGYLNTFGGRSSGQEREIEVNYSSVGEKIIKAKVTLSNGKTLRSRSKFNIRSLSEISYDTYIPVSGSWNGGTYTANAYVIYGCGNNNKLRKPVIVTDGFDPGNKRNFPGIYEYFNRENLVEKLIADGYDVIILDFDKGAGYIQRNAHVLISTVNEVNKQLEENESYEQLVIVGPSMGGIITRYALSYMEQNNLNHNTRLYISFDSPHLGANIPLGLQYWLRFFANKVKEQGAIEGKERIYSIACQQLLSYHINKSDYRTNLINDKYYSFPSQCRKVAFSNGSRNNADHLFEPGTQLIDYSYVFLGFGVKGHAWALPQKGTSNKKIFKGLYMPPSEAVGYGLKVKSTGKNLPLDGASGGYFNTAEKIYTADDDPKSTSPGNIKGDHPHHCFIPTVSALSLSPFQVNSKFNVGSFPNYPKVNNPFLSPFDAIYASSSNTEHMNITSEIAGWFKDEIGEASSYIYLQNRTVANYDYFNARKKIYAGNDVTSSISNDDFIVKNNTGLVTLKAGEEIHLEKGTEIRPTGNGTAYIFIDPYECNGFQGRSFSVSQNSTFEEIDLEDSNIEPDLQTQSSDNLHISAFPNPFNEYVNVEYVLEEQSDVEISIFNVKGEQVKQLSKQKLNIGKHNLILDTKDLVAGLYLCVINQHGKRNKTVKIQKL